MIIYPAVKDRVPACINGIKGRTQYFSAGHHVRHGVNISFAMIIKQKINGGAPVYVYGVNCRDTQHMYNFASHLRMKGTPGDTRGKT